MRGKIMRFATIGAVSLTMLLPAGIAHADDVERKGSCGKTSRWEFDLDRDDGRIEVEYEVTARKAGEKWRVRIWQNDNRIFKGTRVTRRDDDDRPDFEVELKRPDRKGTDRFRARAVNTVTGEVCKGNAKI